ncbi:FdhF/YdeP family oxidoreductase [Micrococcales bacterium 31B]|nr:FdhF/YdeP family oxidoreductase [Micrococcales bacterium 31B]
MSQATNETSTTDARTAAPHQVSTELGGDIGLEIEHPHDWATGVPAITNSLKIGIEQMGPKRTLLTLLKVNQPDGFDCPGCAWPEPKHTHTAEFCENGAKAVAEEATTRRVTPAFFAQHSVADLRERSDFWLGQQGRIQQPMLLREGSTHYEETSWSEALDLIAEHLNALASPHDAIFYTSGRTSNEAAYAYQLLARALGTNNMPDCSNMCHESSGSALTETIGVGKGTVTLEDVETAELVVVAGQNPGTNHPRMLSALEINKHNGGSVVSVNPLPEPGLMRFKNPQKVRGIIGEGTKITDQFCHIRLGGDLAFFRGIAACLIAADDAAEAKGHPPVLDRDFIEKHTLGFDDYLAAVRATSWDDIEASSGLSRGEIETVAQRFIASRKTIVCWAMGLTQHKNSVPTIREVVNVLLLQGNIGKPGAGVCPVRGHSNVQGDRTMGIFEKPTEGFLAAVDAEHGITSPREYGYDVVEAITAMRESRDKVFIGMGGNFVRATPDSRATEEALENCALTVHVSTKLNNSHAITGRTALILPTHGRTEIDLQLTGKQFVTVEDSMGMVHASRGNLPPVGEEVLSEVAIVCEIARRTVGDLPAGPSWRDMREDYAVIRGSISRVIPGFEDFNERVTDKGGFSLPNAPRDSRTFNTHTGKANFTVNAVDVLRVPEGHLLLQTVRSHDQYNTTIYGMNDRYRGIKDGRRVVFVNPADLDRLSLRDGDLVDITSLWPAGADGRGTSILQVADLVETDGALEERVAPAFRVVAFDTKEGCVAAYFPETNVLIPLHSTADTSNTPTSKSVIVRLTPSTVQGEMPVR